jgi:hypothetical protein
MAADASDPAGYTTNQLQQMKDNNVVQKLTELQQKLGELGYSVSEPDIRFPQDPSIWISGFSGAVVAQVKMQLSGQKVVINFRPKCPNSHQPGRDAKDLLKQALHGTGFQPRNDEAYAPLADFKTKKGFPGGIERADVPAIHTLLSTAIKALAGAKPRS